jgi:hypothetical protein
MIDFSPHYATISTPFVLCTPFGNIAASFISTFFDLKR